MQINYPQFDPSKTTRLSPIYMLSGDVPLLAQEGRDKLKQVAQQQGHEECELIDTSVGFDWGSLNELAATQSLFCEKKLIDIRHNSAKFDAKAQKQIAAYLANPSPDVIVVISCAKLTPAQKKAKWMQAIANSGTLVIIWPINANELPRWIQQRLKAHGIQASHESVQLLSHYTEGNLLATHQAIEKLSLLNTQGRIDTDDMAKVISNNARFNVFDCSQYALQGNPTKTRQTLQQLKDSGAEPTLILWALSRDLRELQKLLYYQNHDPGAAHAFLKSQWKNRQALLRQASNRCQLPHVNQLIHHAHYCDKVIKGRESGNVFLILEDIALGLCGKPLNHPQGRHAAV